MFVAIAACDPQGICGKEGQLPWNIPEDMHHFRRTTKGQTVIMGYTTYKSLPNEFFLERRALVLSARHQAKVATFDSIDTLLDHCHEGFVIGGVSVFRQFFDRGLIHRALISHIHSSYSGDAIFPLSYLNTWSSTSQEFNDFTLTHYAR